ncbi:MAG TPA: exodeoxyribonuclease VII large subunit, partial [Candidatus Melainabacteria bacterium]|nr:exodeoxyribonuclease VII large subunit [Candidatus Melainabacteria bacterium]
MYSPKDYDNQLRPVLTVSELTGQIKDILEGTFSQVYVAGEISNAKVYPSGHWYFSLKDQNSTLPCVCFKGANQYI